MIKINFESVTISHYTYFTKVNYLLKLFFLSYPVCTPAGTVYHCTCEDQYAWPYNNCVYDECNFLNEDSQTCTCVHNFSSGGQMCVPESGRRNVLEYIDIFTRLKCLFLYLLDYCFFHRTASF